MCKALTNLDSDIYIYQGLSRLIKASKKKDVEKKGCKEKKDVEKKESCRGCRMYTGLSLTSGLGLQSLTTGSIPLVARRQCVGWGCRQLTMESSPLNTRTMFVVLFSHIKKEPSSDPATKYWPLLEEKQHRNIQRLYNDRMVKISVLWTSE